MEEKKEEEAAAEGEKKTKKTKKKVMMVIVVVMMMTMTKTDEEGMNNLTSSSSSSSSLSFVCLLRPLFFRSCANLVFFLSFVHSLFLPSCHQVGDIINKGPDSIECLRIVRYNEQEDIEWKREGD